MSRMLYDLPGQETMSPIVGLLFSAIKENYQRLQLITDGMSQNEVDYKGPNNSFNSTAQLIQHIMRVDLNWVYRIKGESLPQELQERYGPMIDENQMLPMVKGISLKTLISNYDQVIKMLEAECSQLKDTELDQVVTFGHENEKQATIRWGLWHMADHSRYHQANINQLRKWYKETSQGLGGSFVGYIKELRKLVGNRPVIMVGVTVIVKNPDGHILLQKRTDNFDWGTIGGGMELGETFEDTARRELFEEAGLRAEELKFITNLSGQDFYYKYPNGDEVYYVIAVFEAIKVQGTPTINDDEGLDLKYFSMDEPIENLNSNSYMILKETGYIKNW